jgi:hypothetical protein
MSMILQSVIQEELEITAIKNRHELDNIMKEWEMLQKIESNPVADVDPYLYVCELESLGQHAQPFILCLRRDGLLEAMLIGRYQKVSMPIRLGYLTIMKPQVGEILVYHGGILGRKNAETCSLLLGSLRDHLNKGEADIAVFNHFHCDSIMSNIIRSEVSLLSFGYSARIEGHWKMDVPECMNKFYERKSSKTRKELQRQIRKLEKSHQVFMKTYSDEDSLDEGILAIADISSKTYQHALEAGFLDNLQMRSYLLLAAKRGLLRMYILYINNEAVAFEWGIKYENTFFGRGTGFDPKWRNWSVGTVLFLKFIETLCEDSSIDLLDIGFGDSEYKKTYCNTRTNTRSLFIFSDRFYPRLLNIVRQTMTGIWMAAAYTTNKLGIERKLKRVWRDRLSRKVAMDVKEIMPTITSDPDNSVR